MSVTEYERHQLFTWFEEHMGTERATTMMNLVPPVGWADVATRRDIDRIDAKFDAFEARLMAELDAKLATLRAELLRTFGTWLFAGQATVIAALSLVIALTR